MHSVSSDSYLSRLITLNSLILLLFENSITLESVNIKTVDDFWSGFGIALHLDNNQYFNENDVSSANDFLLVFHKNKWEKPVVLFIDEFDKLYRMDIDIRTFLKTLRGTKNMKEKFAIWSAVAISPFSILRLKLNLNTSPFNIQELFHNLNLTLK